MRVRIEGFAVDIPFALLAQKKFVLNFTIHCWSIIIGHHLLLVIDGFLILPRYPWHLQIIIPLVRLGHSLGVWASLIDVVRQHFIVNKR
jgi:hypothetical protein